MKHIAVIPARSGSKGLENKNIKLLNGKPLMAYTIEAATNSGVFDKIIVSTDSEEYAAIAQKYGAEIPYLRSMNLSKDTTSSWDVVNDILKFYKQKGQNYDTVCLLQPTSPLRDAEDIKGAYAMLETKKAKTIISVCETQHSPLWTNTLPENLSLESFISQDLIDKNRQSLPKYYQLNGAIYIIETSQISDNHNLYSEYSYAYIMSHTKSIDIDNLLDFLLVELIVEKTDFSKD
ncbi:acylneuraminate cytidylyltransferase family protein [Planococcus sp. A6]|uniref:acylneuraminate cytidylyltransferase family protein n=1 Tax=Planococcus sp. A6 TaxID=2992760 RepID=UPI00237BE2B2|nr:acylneuraminate cytidylyltransferase family protein [Planococcus sp. A6]MDE0582108.1 acylneuraminate cytidylyltransferase family protein [Planococcus sp. A6]